ncbi:MAG: major capsid protein [Microvirus sp.]|nr:MAG: major capsid protein [Microvirus sp.]
MHRNKSVSTHQFAMIPKADIPRSRFNMQKALKTTFDSGLLVPILCEEILPGDSVRLKATLFGRLATPLVPVMDNLYLDTQFFFIPNRLVWENWQRFMGEQDAPTDSTSYSVPSMVSQAGGYPPLSLFDYFGLPVAGQVGAAGTVPHSVLPLRGYNLVWNQWYRDQNIQDSVTVNKDDGPDPQGDYGILRRGKRKDYFSGALPFVQKGPAVTIPLGISAPVVPTGTGLPTFRNAPAGGGISLGQMISQTAGADMKSLSNTSGSNADMYWGVTALSVDLTGATASTVNQLRQSIQLQRLLERDARGGTRYREILKAHFSVDGGDPRLQRPEYLGGGTSMIAVSPVAQTSATDISGSATPQANLAAIGTVLAHGHGFTQSFVEHGYILGLASVRADLTYQQGLRRHWSRQSKVDFYWPVFSHLGEQAILRKEIYCVGDPNLDDLVFGYQERHAEYRYNPSEITGLFRSSYSAPLDYWHLAQNFTTPPTLSPAFIEEHPPLQRIMAVGDEAAGQEIILDVFYDITMTRPMPLYAVPGMMDHF